jgi:hypothetical protein
MHIDIVRTRSETVETETLFITMDQEKGNAREARMLPLSAIRNHHDGWMHFSF